MSDGPTPAIAYASAPDRAAALKTAFDKALVDPAAIADLAKIRIELDPMRGDEIVAVGSADDILRSAADHTRVVDLQGRAVVPGFVDTPMTKDIKKNPLFASPERVAKGIVSAMDRRRAALQEQIEPAGRQRRKDIAGGLHQTRLSKPKLKVMVQHSKLLSGVFP